MIKKLRTEIKIIDERSSPQKKKGMHETFNLRENRKELKG